MDGYLRRWRSAHASLYACEGKSQINNIVRARWIARRMHRRYSDVYQAYFCANCHSFHVGRKEE